MRIDRYLAKSRIIDLKSRDLEEVLRELLAVCHFPSKEKIDKEALVKALMEREQSLLSYLGRGLSMPHLRLPMRRRCMMVLGRAPEGLLMEGVQEYREIRLVLLVLTSNKNDQHLTFLASVASIFEKNKLWNHVDIRAELPEFREQILKSFGRTLLKKKPKGSRHNRIMVREAAKIAKQSECSAILLFGDTFVEDFQLENPFSANKAILVSRSGVSSDISEDSKDFDEHLQVNVASNSRLGQLRSAILVGLTRGIFRFHDRLCCLSGIPGSNHFDTLVVIDIEREFQPILVHQSGLVPHNVRPEVIERVIAIATELGVEGREGQSVGALFIVGDASVLKPFTKPLILNPFFGYKEEDRNILSPFMDETVKELSSIDGAFIISGDGVLESAGSLIYAPAHSHTLPGGFGARHAAAVAISMAVDCLAIVVSSTSGQVSIVRHGEMIPLIEKGNSPL